jgi:hypothetical protein
MAAWTGLPGYALIGLAAIAGGTSWVAGGSPLAVAASIAVFVLVPCLVAHRVTAGRQHRSGEESSHQFGRRDP